MVGDVRMKIVHIVPDTAHGPLSYSDLTAGGRGVTGSEQATLHLARAQVQMGHDVLVYMPTDHPGYSDGVQILDIRMTWPRLRRADTADVAISWISADPLRLLGSKPLKIHSLQINDWLVNAINYEQHVDVFVAVSQAHKAALMTEAMAPVGDWEIIPNGTAVIPNPAVRKARKCAYLSSPDRGLHWLLAMWPEIHFAYPDAELHIYYEVQRWLDKALLMNSEVGNRAKYTISKLNNLQKHGVVVHGAVSPAAVAADLMTSDVMLYPCDPIRFTEGFGVAVLDACRAGAVPVITDVDALGEIYAESGAVIVPRGDTRAWTDHFVEAAIQLLGDEEDKALRRTKVQAFAEHYSWGNVAQTWQSMIERRLHAR